MSHESIAVEITIQTAHQRYVAKQWGPEEGIPFLAFHGWLDNAATFDFLSPQLPELRIIAVDLPGHGLSEWRPSGLLCHFVDYVRDAMSIADALSWKTFGLLGHSMGGALSTLIAGAFPNRMNRMILIDAIGPYTMTLEEGPLMLAKSIRELDSSSRQATTYYPTLEDAIFIRQKAGDLLLESATALASRGVKKTEKGYIWNSDPRLRASSPMKFLESQVIYFLNQIKCKSLLIVAENGLPFDESIFIERCRAIPHLEKVLLPGNHHLHMENPVLVAETIRAFLKRGM